jgi:5-methyltetrahydrofolate--homocysteine methyltransferase
MLNPLGEIERAFRDVSGVDQMRRFTEMAVDQKIQPSEIIASMRKGLSAAGTKYEQGEYFLSELVMSGIMARALSEMLKPYLRRDDSRSIAKVVIGTVKGDLHDIGKNLVSIMLSSAGFEVQDLGVDVPPEKFVETVKREKPRVVAMSCLLTVAMDTMENVMDRLTESGFRSRVKVLVGGRPITSDFAQQIGADGYAADAIEAASVAKGILAR